ncbi:aberrant root formation protein 4 isoform X2 [Arachis ipaensis]|uniref:aberrant root formation protein 4 isoform X2 n=1 Tax=Arachis ipaensis TaxID=130454 RepID=UPI000A2AFF7F|nr:aberrant root formation protein 4 isoform X2 [Arachis ipaensis]XP_025658053.1 aberrant root formation protein 4 isoform X2 [Arachis hypogaea]QHN86463.1 Aberrant root formation protein [Arachis hypogaea]QHN86464.1 Aberrant root formation protein [Arachis hypogaea]
MSSMSGESETVSFQASETQNTIQRILQSCSKLVEAGDIHESDSTISELVNFLDSLSDAALSDLNNEPAQNDAFDALTEIHQYICSPSLAQEAVDALSFELPKAVSKFAGISNRFLDKAISIIDQFLEKCGPRDMLSILCNTIGYSSNMTKAASYIVPPLSGLSKVFTSIKRRHFEQVQVAVPIILNVLKAVALDSDDADDAELESVFHRAVGIANSIYEVCNKLDGVSNEKLRALLGLYVLQCLALLSASISYKDSTCHLLVLELSQISSYCGLTYMSLLTAFDVETVVGFVFGEDKDAHMSCLSHVKHGVALSVVWGLVSEEVAHATKESLVAIKDDLHNNQTKRWQAIGTLKHVLSFVNLPWELKKHTINFLLCITDGCVSGEYLGEHSEWSSYMPNIFTALQAIKMVIMYAPEPEVRKKSFALLKAVLTDIPDTRRFDILKALITNTDSSSMIAIFIDIVRREMHMEVCNSTSVKEAPDSNNETHPDMPFWTPSVLELVELVLRPPRGGPPSLPDASDAVLSALNLYRFVLMTESTGNIKTYRS